MTNNPLTALYQKLDHLPGDYSRPVRGFLQHHLGTTAQPAPLISRERELQRLDDWLKDRQAGAYARLIGPAGCGKSTLLAQWAARREAAGGFHVIYFPISVRFETASEVTALRALCVRLAQAHRESPDAHFGAAGYLSTLAGYLRRWPGDGKPLLVILDGLDEARGWEVGPALFPADPPVHLRVLAAADEPDRQPEWTPWLEWEARGLAARLPLERLDVNGHGLGDPAQIEAELAQLQPQWRTAGLGEAQALAVLNACAVACGPLSAADLQALSPEHFSSAEAAQRAGQALRPFLTEAGPGRFVFRHPALAGHFVGRLVKQGQSAAWQTRFARYGQAALAGLQAGALRPSQVSAYAVRYCSAHLRLAEAELEAYTPMLSESWRRAWGHLEGADDGFLNDVRRLWLRAGRAGPAGLAIQIRALLAWSSVRSRRTVASAEFILDQVREDRLHPRLALEMARGLDSDNERVPALLGLALRLPENERPAGLTEALKAARQVPEACDRAQLLKLVAEHLPETERAAVLAEALTAGRQTRQTWSASAGAAILAATAAQLPAAERAALLAEALAQARSEQDGERRVQALSKVAAHLPEAERRAVLSEAFQLALDVVTFNGDGDPVIFREGIVGTGAALLTGAAGPDARREVLTLVLTGIRRLSDASDRNRVADEIAKQLPPADRTHFGAAADTLENPASPAAVAFIQSRPAAPVDPVAEALALARGLDQNDHQVGALLTRVTALPAPARPAILAEAVAAARRIKWPDHRAAVLMKLAEALPAEQRPAVLAEALASARAAATPGDRAAALITLAGHLPPDQRLAVLTEARAAAQASHHRMEQVGQLLSIAAQLPQADRPPIWKEVLASIRRQLDDQTKAGKIRDLARQLPPEADSLWAEAVEITRTIANCRWRAEALCALANHGRPSNQPARLAEALAAARAEAYAYARCEALLAVARSLPVDEQRPVWEDAIAAAQQIDPRNRLGVVTRVLQQLPADADLLAAALFATCAVWDLEAQSKVLLQIADYLPERERVTAAAQSLVAAQSLWEGEVRARAVLEAARRAPPAFKATAVAAAVEAAWDCEHDFQQVDALAEVLEVVPPEDRPRVAAEALVLAIRADESGTILNAAARWLAPELVPDMFRQARAVIRKKRRHGDACYDLVRLARLMPAQDRPAVYQEAVADTLAVRDDPYSLPSRLHLLAEHLPAEAGDLLTQVVAAAQELKPADRDRVLKAAAGPRPAIAPVPAHAGRATVLGRRPYTPQPEPALTGVEADKECEALTAQLQAARTQPRPRVLQTLAVLIPRLTRLADGTAARATAQAMLDALRVWP